MIQTVSKCNFRDAFRTYGRTGDFSYAALGLLFDFFENMGEETGEQIELDVLAICCDYCESTLKEINQEYIQDFQDLNEAEEWLQDHTYVVGKTSDRLQVGQTSDTIIFASF